MRRLAPMIRRSRPVFLRLFPWLALACTSCTKTDLPPPLAARIAPIDATSLFRAQPIGEPTQGNPWIAHLRAADLDRDKLVDVLVCDARKNEIAWVRQTAPGV